MTCDNCANYKPKEFFANTVCANDKPKYTLPPDFETKLASWNRWVRELTGIKDIPRIDTLNEYCFKCKKFVPSLSAIENCFNLIDDKCTNYEPKEAFHKKREKKRVEVTFACIQMITEGFPKTLIINCIDGDDVYKLPLRKPCKITIEYEEE